MSRVAEKGYKMVVELLLQNGAQPELEDGSGGRTPLSRPYNLTSQFLIQNADLRSLSGRDDLHTSAY